MNLWTTSTRWELRLGLRSTRCRVAVALYLAFCCVPSVMLFIASRQVPLGTTTFLYNLLEVQGFPTLALAAALAGFRSNLAAWPEMRSVLASAPLSSTGYLVGRWLGLVTLLIPVTLIPLIVAAALAIASGSPWQDTEAWSWSWALQIAPVALIGSAMWLGLVTIMGHELVAFGLGYVGMNLLLSALNEVLIKFRLLAEFAPTLGTLQRLGIWYVSAREAIENLHDPQLISQWVSSEAPFDPRAMAEWYLPRIWLGMAFSGLALALGVIYVRRTQRAMKPRVVREDHPLRTYLLLLLRLRDHFIPAAAPGAKDLLTVACGVLILTSGFFFNFARQRHFQALASERYEATTASQFAPLTVAIRPALWKIRGEIQNSGSVALDVETRLHFEATRDPDAGPQSQLAFSLNEHLTIESVEAEGHRVTPERAWDRVRLTLEPPLAAGESVALRWYLSGRPGHVKLPLYGHGNETFVTKFDRFHQTRFVRDMTNFARSQTLPATSPRRVELATGHLSPIPRYTSWTLEMVESGNAGEQPTIPEEIIRPEVDFEIDLRVPANLFVADACGHSTQASHSQLTGTCRMPLAEYTIYGGPLEVTELSGVTFALLKIHQNRATEFSESLARTAALSNKAWPGVKGFDDLIVAEWVAGFKQYKVNSNWAWGLYNLRGKLLMLHEDIFRIQFFSMGELLVSDLLTRELIAQREVDPNQALFFQNFYAALMLQRMGLGDNDATMSGRPSLEAFLNSKSLFAAGQYSMNHWKKRLPAVLADLRSRTGAKAIMNGVQKFLATPGREVGTARELFTFFERESGVSLRRFYEDFIEGGAVPKLLLKDVEMSREEGGFRVSGRVENTGTGEVFCPLLVRTETETTQVLLRVDSKSSTPFNIRARERPFLVELDPSGTCHRLVSLTRLAAERVSLE